MDARHKFITIPFGLVVPLVGAAAFLFNTHSTAAGNKEDISSVIQAQKADHDVLTEQQTEIKYIKEATDDLNKDFDEYRTEQRYVNQRILQQLEQLGN